MIHFRCLCLLLVLCCCNSSRPHTEAEEIHVSVLRGPSAIAFAQWMEETPVIDGRPLSVRILDSPELMQAVLIKGETGIAVLPMASAARLHDKGIPYRLAGCPIWGTLYWVGRKGEERSGDRPVLHVFGAGTTPDLLARQYLRQHPHDCTLNYSLATAPEILQGLLAGKVDHAVLGEPFLSMALRKDSTLRIVADLNRPDSTSSSPGFAQTAILYAPALEKSRETIDSLLALSCRFAVEQPEQAIRILEQKGIFAPGMLTPESIGRCRIDYKTASEAQEEIHRFLQLAGGYEPPEPASFFRSVLATLLRGVAGMSLSLMAAVMVSFLCSRRKWMYEWFRPLLAAMRSVPVISFILLALIFLHAESIPLLIAFLTMFPLLTENLTKGIRNRRETLSIMARQFGIGRRNRWTQVVYPQLKPFLYSGLASASGFGWRAVIMGEVLAQCSPGIGGEMKRAQIFIAVPELIAWTGVAVLISFLFDKGISRLARLQIPIHYKAEGNRLPAATGKNDIRIHDLSFRYGSAPVLSHFSHMFEKGLIHGITAPSGTGKTTLLNLIGNVLKPAQGEIETGCKTGIAHVFQEPELLGQLTIAENIALPLAAYLKKETALEQAALALQWVELEDLADRLPGELSFGQQQRVAIARALVCPSPLLLMDEPFKGLDEALGSRIIGRIRERQAKNGQTILFTSHNPEELRLFADKIVRL